MRDGAARDAFRRSPSGERSTRKTRAQTACEAMGKGAR